MTLPFARLRRDFSLGVKNLLLYHTEEMNLANRKEMYFEEGSKYYHGALWIPDDLESMCL